ncbi:MAG: 2-dehydropantoate 2-reductase [Pseudonocardiales bacterium]
MLRIAVMGSGGLGGYFGALLARGGSDVTFVARGAHLAAMRSSGLRVDPGVVHVDPVQATDDPAEIGVVDFVVVCVKLWDTQDALAQIAPVVGPDTTVVSFQNGVLKEDLLTAAFGADRVIGGVAYIATTLSGPGVITKTGPLERLVFGELDGTTSSRVQTLLSACLAGGIAAEISPDIAQEIWKKFVFLVGLSATTTTMRLPIGPIREDPQTRGFLLDVMREVVAVARALGVSLPTDYAEQRLAFADGVSADMTSSMHHDLQRGNRLEVPWLSGAVADLGRSVGVATPLNRAVADILSIRARAPISN